MTFAENILGIQHIAVPTMDVEKTVAFYGQLGFEEKLRTKGLRGPVVFMGQQNLMLEFYVPEACAGRAGAVDHFAIDVKDVEAAFTAAKEAGFQLLDQEIQSRPFWERGVRFFNIEGPNAEKIEFSQKL
ncbi:conserved hypothetical protein [uncultured Eubacteriales bacterium]|uniref:VOC domain-containing protein n=1 Tax=uncultured Eubacteriales bacterium TaxID=172733 RepID=A0A212KGE5_9FIRM|nr:conserved hypothetical protein [uncultured Eubacteriales bacterium]